MRDARIFVTGDKIAASELKALTKLGLEKNHWTRGVKGIGSGYWRVVGEVEELIDKAKELSQRTLRWRRLCTNFKKGLARQRRVIFAAFAAGCVGFGIVLVWKWVGFDRRGLKYLRVFGLRRI